MYVFMYACMYVCMYVVCMQSQLSGIVHKLTISRNVTKDCNQPSPNFPEYNNIIPERRGAEKTAVNIITKDGIV